ncbi:efflux RND transporter periplasmic adaptor subunit [Sphingomonas naphthae]|uniref:Efflux RND transporter periplasmic adaptor subunit n=1 Tax=Sphingomonas naphthae TaxID=1813468 RepID=A0ABY7TGN6_9SPHN|nr:efflux RND transporter periplasmic adaptor subunit [Sphingomonas naphthae]WCT72223.1 efflux RND transporter periplasmic adaptor subunit [Sphingomonas naphthae]
MATFFDTVPVRLLAASPLALALVACGEAPADPRVGAPLVRVGTAGGAANRTQDYTGVVSARVQSNIGFRVSGKVIERLVDAGQSVRRGQPLMRIDRTDLALATVAQSGVVEAARARFLQAAADEKRYRDLVSAGAVSASAYDQAKATADAAKAQLDAAVAQAGVARNEAGYAVLLADADGVVVETLAEPGQVVTAGQTVVRLARSGPREATIGLPETIRPAIGSTAAAAVFNAPHPGTARLRQLSNAADPLTRTYEARYVLEGAAAGAPLGATVTISLPSANAGTALEVPLSALLDTGKGPGVWVVSGKPAKVDWRPVRVARIGEEAATVTGGLRPGERFVALGAHLLHPGEAVRVADQVASR